MLYSFVEWSNGTGKFKIQSTSLKNLTRSVKNQTYTAPTDLILLTILKYLREIECVI